jgi:hypothetical protein
MATLNATPTTLREAMDAAAPGDVIKMASGAYGQVASKVAAGRHLGDVILDAQGATIEGQLWPVRYHGFQVIGGSWSVGVRLNAGTQDVTVRGIETHGDGSKTSYGVMAPSGGRNIKVLDCDLRGHKSGVNFGGVEGFEVTANSFRHMRNDCCSLYGVSKGLVSYNRFLDTRPANADEHPDMVQFAAIREVPATEGRPAIPGIPVLDVVIKRNYGRALDSQGIVMFNHEGMAGSKRITIEDNDITIGYYHGIAWNGCEGLILRRNRVATFPGSSRFATINVSGNTFAEPRYGNVVEDGAGRKGYSEPGVEASAGSAALDLQAKLSEAQAALEREAGRSKALQAAVDEIATAVSRVTAA